MTIEVAPSPVPPSNHNPCRGGVCKFKSIKLLAVGFFTLLTAAVAATYAIVNLAYAERIEFYREKMDDQKGEIDRKAAVIKEYDDKIAKARGKIDFSSPEIRNIEAQLAQSRAEDAEKKLADLQSREFALVLYEGGRFDGAHTITRRFRLSDGGAGVADISLVPVDQGPGWTFNHGDHVNSVRVSVAK